AQSRVRHSGGGRHPGRHAAHQHRRPRAGGRLERHGRDPRIRGDAAQRPAGNGLMTGTTIDRGAATGSAASPLQRTAATATDIWNDSADVDELAYAIEHGAVGATANPTIVHDIWKKDPS